ncbi:MAG: hypothetical protein ACI8Y4_004064 [Candidatus Poriferisodalaceae bacterium]
MTTRRGVDGGTRYYLVQSLRAFAESELDAHDELEAARRRHGSYFLGLLTDTPRGQRESVDATLRQLPDLIEYFAAIRYLATHDPQGAVEVITRINAGACTELGMLAQWVDEARHVSGLVLNEQDQCHADAALVRAATFAAGYDEALRACRSVRASGTHDSYDLAEASIFEANIISNARPERSVALLDNARTVLLPSLEGDATFVTALEHMIRGTTLLRLRRFNEAEVELRTALTAGSALGLFYPVTDAALGYLAHLRGDDIYAASTDVRSVYSWTQAAASELVRARKDPDQTRRRLARLAADICDGAVPLQESSLLGVFARCAWLAGDDNAAVELLNVFSPRVPYGADLAMDKLSRIEDWPDTEFDERSCQFLADPDRQRRALQDAPRLLADQINKWQL